jgi:hypothetical protein
MYRLSDHDSDIFITFLNAVAYSKFSYSDLIGISKLNGIKNKPFLRHMLMQLAEVKSGPTWITAPTGLIIIREEFIKQM